MTLVWTILIGLASYRLWKLAAEDAIAETPREWVLARSPERMRELVECPWCLGSWVAFGVTWAVDAAVGLPAPVLVGLAAAAIVGMIGER